VGRQHAPAHTPNLPEPSPWLPRPLAHSVPQQSPLQRANLRLSSSACAPARGRPAKAAARGRPISRSELLVLSPLTGRLPVASSRSCRQQLRPALRLRQVLGVGCRNFAYLTVEVQLQDLDDTGKSGPSVLSRTRSVSGPGPRAHGTATNGWRRLPPAAYQDVGAGRTFTDQTLSRSAETPSAHVPTRSRRRPQTGARPLRPGDPSPMSTAASPSTTPAPG